VKPQVVREVVVAAPPRRSVWPILLLLVFLGGLAAVVVLPIVAVVGLVASATSTSPSSSSLTENHFALNELGTQKIAVIRVEGAIVEGEGYVKQQIDRVREDTAVKAVVLRIDSPGGTVTGSDYMYHHLTKLREERGIPIVVSMGGMAASGGYYVAMAVGDQENVIFAEPTTWTGSIGVIIPHYNVAGLMERFEVAEDAVKSHPLKNMGSPFKEMSDEERAIFQALVDDSFARFKEIIRSGRPKFRDDPAALDALATGQVFTTNQALANGLVDREGFIEAAIDRAIELASLSRDDVQVIDYEQPFTLFGGLLASSRTRPAGDSHAELAALLELTRPRAYYLFDWIPPTTAE
jgi:protease-4